jgi:hypothetical protein
VLFIIAAIVVAIFLLFHINRRVKKYKGLMADHYEKMITAVQKPNLPEQTQDTQRSDNHSNEKRG